MKFLYNMRNHIFNKWYAYFTIIFLISVYSLISLINHILLEYTIYVYILKSATSIILIVWSVYVFGFIKIQNKLTNSLLNKKWKKYVIVILLLLLMFLIWFINDYTIALTIFNMHVSYNLAIYAYTLMDKLIEYNQKRVYMLNEKEWIRANQFITRYNYIAVAENTPQLDGIANSVETLNISYPKILRPEMHIKLRRFFKNPDAISTISAIFSNDITLDDDGNIYINNKIETNPSKVGLFFIRKFKENAQREILIESKDMLS